MDSEKNMVITLLENTRGFKDCMYRPVQQIGTACRDFTTHTSFGFFRDSLQSPSSLHLSFLSFFSFLLAVPSLPPTSMWYKIFVAQYSFLPVIFLFKQNVDCIKLGTQDLYSHIGCFTNLTLAATTKYSLSHNELFNSSFQLMPF